MSDSSVPPGGHRSGRGPRRRPGRPHRSGPPRGRSGPDRPPQGDAAREAALDTLRAVREDDAYANLTLPRLLRERRVSGRDAALATDLAYGACRARGLLDAVLSACVDRPLDRLDGVVLDALRLGAQQLLRTRIPAHAAVGATVELVRSRAGSKPTGFVNAVLRRVAERDEAGWVAELAPDAATDPVGHAAFVHAHPRWIAEVFGEALPDDELEPALAADDARPAVHLAARPGEISAEELAAVTGGEEAPYSPYGVLLTEGGDPGDLEAVREGLAAVQDEGSQLVALAAARAPLTGRDELWLDLCAGPGGKAALLGALAAIEGATLDAVDRAPHRAALVEKATAGLPVRVHTGDAREIALPEAAYDRVLVDAPCTGLGALRRRPEARWRRRPEDVAELTALQRDLLTHALERVRPGGVVTYATCSPHPAETVDVVRAVVEATGAEVLDTAASLPELDASTVGTGPGIQLWPHRHGTDAMYCATLRRVA
ncbi:RsmB/NOP family class I SAM-dependent RNA methyltransferase [Actinomycetospora termitidis]|uniref:RsmB/NOP family class I SAM-dependent RNA methyltransferase n=1 Tax=Actinomycetospora termitidis TaxID=3053470 RepID=A0ABT7MBH7_9PSEU|nr:RsmB/NOP family class I SAM-dependent RNA methyltransferase [Actinomycetospora sp. Odt1-22]MDL5157998.1 RsmB/NOP family class I SAM-dependent RNA methyltransferase [Actinomycetospora sp. Odt1-22]